MIEILMRDQLFSYQRVRHLLWRSYATTPGLSTGPIWSEISTKIGHFHQKCIGWCFAYYVYVETRCGARAAQAALLCD